MHLEFKSMSPFTEQIMLYLDMDARAALTSRDRTANRTSISDSISIPDRFYKKGFAPWTSEVEEVENAFIKFLAEQAPDEDLELKDQKHPLIFLRYGKDRLLAEGIEVPADAESKWKASIKKTL